MGKCVRKINTINWQANHGVCVVVTGNLRRTAGQWPHQSLNRSIAINLCTAETHLPKLAESELFILPFFSFSFAFALQKSCSDRLSEVNRTGEIGQNSNTSESSFSPPFYRHEERNAILVSATSGS